jgi:uncharacterized protein
MPTNISSKDASTTQSIYSKYGYVIGVAMWLFFPFVLWGMFQSVRSNNNNINQWLPRDLPEREQYETFKAQFGSDEFAIISWASCSLKNKNQLAKLEHFASIAQRATTNQPGVSSDTMLDHISDQVENIFSDKPTKSASLDARLFQSPILTGPRVINEMVKNLGLTQIEAATRLQGTLVGKDGNATCAILRLTQAGSDDRIAVVNAIQQSAHAAGLKDDDIHLGGGAVFNAHIDLESEAATNQLIPVALIVTMVIAWLVLRSIKLTLFICMTSGYAGAVAHALVYFAGGQMNLIMIVMPVLVYVLTLSACIHLVNYYRDTVSETGIQGAVTRAVRHGLMPCLLAAATTAIGLLSLSVSHVDPIVHFGQFGAAGMLVSLAIVFFLLPVLLERHPSQPASQSNTDADAIEFSQSLSHAPNHSKGARFCNLLLVGRKQIVACCLLLMLAAACGIANTKTSVKTVRLFSPGSRILSDVEFLENHIGALVPLEVTVQFESATIKNTPLQLLSRIAAIGEIQAAMASVQAIDGTMSAATFQPNLLAKLQSSAALQQNLNPARANESQPPRNDIATLNQALITNRYLHEQDANISNSAVQTWRITGRVPGTGATDYQDVIKQVRQRVKHAINSLRLPQEQKAHLTEHLHITGAVPLTHAAQQELLRGLFKSFLAAFVVIGVVMTLLLRSVRAGFVSMLPNIFPAVIVFGAMGWLGQVVDVGAMLTASVAMGIAVDDTLHYLTWFRRATEQGHNRHDAIIIAYHRCATAMLQTTAIAGFGLLTFFLASFQPVSQFGLLMCLMLVTALLGDLVLLPALLATRLGNVFRGKSPTQESERH